jgi:aryl-phospho-beta-D-glucosidase BglC (GH1 family)
MTVNLARSIPLRALLGGCALLLSACLHPASAPEAAGTTNANQPTAAANTTAEAAAVGTTAPRKFTHTSAELLRELKLGWNLGNALDAPDGETSWGNPPITPELLVAVKNAGFRVVRIPVTWSKHTGPGPDYTIEKSWLERVRQVVDQARAAGLYAVINVHHDGADGFTEVEWLTLNDASGKTTPENDALVRARFLAVWTQIAKTFGDYGEELLFESMNEIHDGYGAPDPRHMAFINQLNQTFVDVVRKSGGNNTQRHLVVPGYNTNIEHTLKGFQLPTDSTQKRLTLSVHFYDPYLFALQAKVHTWGATSPGRDDWGQEDHVLKQFDQLKATFIDRGIPVLMGEYGATHQAGYEDYRRYYMEYVTKAAVERGIVPVYWDNGGQNSGGESFGLFDRRSGSVLHPEILDAMIRAASGTGSLSEIRKPTPQK